MDEKIVEAVARALCLKRFGDPSAIHASGNVAWKGYIDEAKAMIAAYEAARPDHVMVPRKMLEAAESKLSRGYTGRSRITGEQDVTICGLCGAAEYDLTGHAENCLFSLIAAHEQEQKEEG